MFNFLNDSIPRLESCCVLNLYLCLQLLQMFLYLIIVVSELMTINASCRFLISVPLITRSCLRSWSCVYRAFVINKIVYYHSLSALLYGNEGLRSAKTGTALRVGRLGGAYGKGGFCAEGRGGRGIISPKIATTCT